jgi:hypothetical protein
MRHELVKRPRLSSGKSKRRGSRGQRTLAKVIVFGAMAYVLTATYGTAEASELSPLQHTCEASVSTAVELAQDGMRINPCAELDTTQVQDDRSPAASSDLFYLIGDADVSAATWRDLAAMDYSHPLNRPLPARDHMMIVWYGGVDLALDRIHSGINR